MAFKFRKNLDGSAYVPTLMYGIGKNAIIFTIGDAVRFNTSGFVDLVDATEQIAGIVAAVVDKNGLPVSTDSGTTNTWTMAAANQTVALNEVSFIPAFPHYAFSCDSDVTQTESDFGKYFSINTTADGIITANESDTIGTLAFQLIGLDPDGDGDASKGLFRIVGSQMGATTIASRAA